MATSASSRGRLITQSTFVVLVVVLSFSPFLQLILAQHAEQPYGVNHNKENRLGLALLGSGLCSSYHCFTAQL